MNHLTTTPNPWRRLDTYLLVQVPELWLMKAHWIAVGSAVTCAVLAAFALLMPLSHTDHPDLSNWQDVLVILAFLTAAWWAWRYSSHCTSVHASEQWSALKLFVSHLLCALMILLPTRVLPAVLFARFDSLPPGSMVEDMRAHRAACKCIEARVGQFMVDDKSENNRVRFGSIACGIWEIPVEDHPAHCDQLDGPAESAVYELLQVHARLGIPAGESELVRVLEYHAQQPPDRAVLLKYRRFWDRFPDLPEPLRALDKMWNSWCYWAGDHEGICRGCSSFGTTKRKSHGTARRLGLRRNGEGSTAWGMMPLA